MTVHNLLMCSAFTLDALSVKALCDRMSRTVDEISAALGGAPRGPGVAAGLGRGLPSAGGGGGVSDWAAAVKNY